MTRPVFAKDFPPDADLDRILDLFDRGNFALAREGAQALLKRSEDDDVRSAARQILKRMEPEPAATYLIAISAVLLAILAGWYWMHGH